MIKYNSQDIVNINEFELIWRWNSPNHAQFSEDELNSIKAFKKEKALEIHELGMNFHNKYSKQMDSVIEIESSDEITIFNWLKNAIGENEY